MILFLSNNIMLNSFCVIINGMEKSVLEFHGGAGYVTGANFLLKTNNLNILLDCGLIQGGEFASKLNKKSFEYDPESIDFLFVSHAHMDHIGRIPKLVKDGFKGKIFSTKATKELAPLMFEDALKIMRQESEEKGEDLVLYDEKDIERALSLWHSLDYYEELLLDELKIYFTNAGHILGSAMVNIEKDSKKFVYTGDLGNPPEPLLPNRDKIENANYLIIESVYGNRIHEDKKERREHLKRVLKEAIKKKRTVLIPAFSLERTQILLYEMNEMIENGELEPIKVYLDSPLAIKITEVFKNNQDLFKKLVKEDIKAGDDIFSFPHFVEVKSPQESAKIIKEPAPKVIMAGSGMSTGGRVLLHEKKLLGDKNTIILFVGYQGVGTLGRRIQDGAKKVFINNEWVKVRAKVESIHGYSAHADMNELLKAVSESQDTLEKVFIALGEMKASLFLAQRIHDYLGLDVHVPQNGEKVEIDF